MDDCEDNPIMTPDEYDLYKLEKLCHNYISECKKQYKATRSYKDLSNSEQQYIYDLKSEIETIAKNRYIDCEINDQFVRVFEEHCILNQELGIDSSDVHKYCCPDSPNQ